MVARRARFPRVIVSPAARAPPSRISLEDEAARTKASNSQPATRSGGTPQVPGIRGDAARSQRDVGYNPQHYVETEDARCNVTRANGV